MESSTSVLVTQSGPIRTLTLNRPDRRNALDPSIIDGINAALSDAEADSHTRALILAGAGKSFCAGADLQHFLHLQEEHGTPIEFLRQVSATVTRLETSPLPIVAALHGHAVAGGLELALACDVVIAAESTLIGDGHVKNNLLPAGGSSVRLPRKVGDSMARWLALTGNLVPARQLLEAGWLHEVVEDSALPAAAAKAAAELAAASGPAQSDFKSLLFDLTTMDEQHGLAKELDDFDLHWKANDVPGSLQVFLHRKTTPNTSTRTENQ